MRPYTNQQRYDVLGFLKKCIGPCSARYSRSNALYTLYLVSLTRERSKRYNENQWFDPTRNQTRVYSSKYTLIYHFVAVFQYHSSLCYLSLVKVTYIKLESGVFLSSQHDLTYSIKPSFATTCKDNLVLIKKSCNQQQ